LAKGYARDKILEALTMGRRSATQPEVDVDDFDIVIAPSQLDGPAAEVVLEPKTFLICEDLMWCRLADVDNCAARKMALADEF
jgi:hypothetical protein